MPRLVVTAEKLKFGRLVLMKGQQFDATEKEARLLKGIHRATDAADMRMNPTVDIPAPVRETRLTEVETAAPKKQRGRPRKYERRDMVATDGPTGEENE